MAISLAQGAFLGFIIYIVYRYWLERKVMSKLPPGPPYVPILGSVFDLPPKDGPQFRHWLKHKEAYGTLSSVIIFGQPIVIIHDKEAATEILEKKAHLSSGRPPLSYAVRECGYSKALPFLPNDELHVRGRKAVHQHFNTPSATARSSSIQHAEITQLLAKILKKPEDLRPNMVCYASGILLRLAYGYSVERTKPDPLVRLIEVAAKNNSSVALPFAWPVDIFPFLHYLPEGFPGAGFKKTVRVWRDILDKAVDIPYKFVLNQRERQTSKPSFVSSLLDDAIEESKLSGSSLGPDTEEFIKRTATSLYGASTGTISTTLEAFIAAMVTYPEVQRKAQEEIDQIIGSGRLPSFEDRHKLPYINALTKEVTRWSPATPMGGAHHATDDIFYGGYVIPKGTALLPAAWWFCHDPEVYSNPESFDPTRFTIRNEPDPLVVFGFGRRVCAGQNFAEATIFTAFASILSVFNISKAVDKNGQEIDIKHDFTAGLTCRFKELPYQIRPRTPSHADLVENLMAKLPKEECGASYLEFS